MGFIADDPTISVSWTNDVASGSTSWTQDTIPDVFDVLTDIDSNLIVDTSGNYINMLGGFTSDSASSSTVVGANAGNKAVTWTAEG